jgi:hypothetical protein
MFPSGFSIPSSLFWHMDFYGSFLCSFCGEENEVFVEPEGGDSQILTEDCSVCCRPNVLHIRIVDQQIIIESEFEG